MNLIHKDSFFSYYQGDSGRDQCVINLKNLFQSKREKLIFESKWQSFLDSDPNNTHIFSKTEDTLEYFTGSIIPASLGKLPRLLLLFGNPAPHSVKAKAMFSSEGKQREHRIWRFLFETGVLSFESVEVKEVSKVAWRNKRLLSKDYISPFEIAMTSFISFPSSASDPTWSGVAGVRKLFGAKAFNLLCNSEFNRLRVVLEKFMPERGMVIAFQKDAFTTLRSAETPLYYRNLCFSGSLIGYINNNPEIFLAAAPPTRLMLSSQAKTAFIKVITEGLKHLQKGNYYCA